MAGGVSVDVILKENMEIQNENFIYSYLAIRKIDMYVFAVLSADLNLSLSDKICVNLRKREVIEK